MYKNLQKISMTSLIETPKIELHSKFSFWEAQSVFEEEDSVFFLNIAFLLTWNIKSCATSRCNNWKYFRVMVAIKGYQSNLTTEIFRQVPLWFLCAIAFTKTGNKNRMSLEIMASAFYFKSQYLLITIIWLVDNERPLLSRAEFCLTN